MNLDYKREVMGGKGAAMIGSSVKQSGTARQVATGRADEIRHQWGGSTPGQAQVLRRMGVDLDELVPLGRQIVFREYRLDGTLVDAEAAVDAGSGIDVEHLGFLEDRILLGRMDAVDRADRDAGGILGADTRLGDDVGHGVDSPRPDSPRPGSRTAPARNRGIIESARRRVKFIGGATPKGAGRGAKAIGFGPKAFSHES